MRIDFGFIISICVFVSEAFYIPGLSPHIYHDGDVVPLYVNKLSSEKTQLPYEYYSVPFFCKPSSIQDKFLNLGEVLRGDRIQNTDYKLTFGTDTQCQILCAVQLEKSSVDSLKDFIKNDYRVEWIVDNLPSAVPYVSQDSPQKKRYESGFPLGKYNEESKEFIMYNHVAINILYEKKADSDDRLITAFEVYPNSVNIIDQKCRDDQNSEQNPKMVIDDHTTSVTFSYSVFWKQENDLTWSNRWSRYLVNSDPEIHWYSIVNSLIILLFLTAMVAIIMIRTLHKDISLYNEQDMKEEQEDTTGWKLVHGDVFRPPKLGGLLAPIVGTGIQLFLMAIATIVFAVFGVLNPSYRGGLISFALFLFVSMGIFAGYYSSRLYKTFRGTSWRRNAFLTAFIFPSVIFVIWLFLNAFIWSKSSSAAIPFGTMMALFFMWIGISFPLVFIGAYFGFKKKAIQHPVRTNQIPRQIPDQVWYLKPVASVCVGGLMPFAVIFIELFFILKSIWQDQFYYMYGFLSLVFVILMITCIEITIVIIYFQLCGEDYRWWWRSFAISSSSALYIFAYSVFYYYTSLDITGVIPALLYFTQSLVACLVYYVCTGTLGFIVTYLFLMKIYSALKVD